MQEFFNLFLQQIQQSSWLEWIAFLTGVLGVYLNAKEDIWGWPVNIVAVALHTVLFFQNNLYSDCVLNAIYIVLNSYGWYHWLYGGKEKDSIPVTRTNGMQWVMFLVAGLILMIGFGYFFDNYTDAELAYYDAFTTGFSLVAIFMMGRKLLENWLFWIVIDVVAIGIYLYKGLNLIAVEYAIFLVICVFGYIGWKKSFDEKKNVAIV